MEKRKRKKSFYFEKLGKEEQAKTQIKQMEGNSRLEWKLMKQRIEKTIEKIKKTKVGSLKRSTNL